MAQRAVRYTHLKLLLIYLQTQFYCPTLKNEKMVKNLQKYLSYVFYNKKLEAKSSL